MLRDLILQLLELIHQCVKFPLHSLNAQPYWISILSKPLMTLSFEDPPDLPIEPPILRSLTASATSVSVSHEVHEAACLSTTEVAF